MPSPVGHVLGGLAFGWLAAPASAIPDQAPAAVEGRWLARLRAMAGHPWTIGFGVLGALADADLFVGMHSRQSHSLGAVAAVFVVAALWGGRVNARRGAACALAYGSHVLLDWMGNDTTPPIGIMALWPFTDGFYQSHLYVFDAISRRYWLPGFWAHNGLAVLREMAVLAPLAAAVWWARRRLAARQR